MNKLLPAILFLISFLNLVSLNLSGMDISKNRYRPSEVIILLKEAASTQALKSGSLNLDHLNRIKQNLNLKEATLKRIVPETDNSGMLKSAGKSVLSRLFLITFPDSIDVGNTIARLRNNPSIEMAQPNYLYSYSFSEFPDDQYYYLQWALYDDPESVNLGVQAAWDITMGDSLVKVGIMDSGIDTNHPDLQNCIWHNRDETPGNGIDDDNNGYIDDINGWNFFNNSNNVGDVYGHGTHIAGVIGAEHNTEGIAGLAPGVKLVSLRLSQANSFTTDAILAAIAYAIENEITLLNCSWGKTGAEDLAVKMAIQEAGQHGCLFITAAGNESVDIDWDFNYPSSYGLDNILAVTALNSDKERRYNYGANTIDMGAPGVEIYSTLPGGEYGYLSGTSMAAPHVTAACALIKSEYPELPFQSIINLATNSATVNPDLALDIRSGRMLNIAGALDTTNNFQFEVDKQQIDFLAKINESDEKNLVFSGSPGLVIDSIKIGGMFDFGSSGSKKLEGIEIPSNGNYSLAVRFNPLSISTFNELLEIFISGCSYVVLLNGSSYQGGTLVEDIVPSVFTESGSPYYICTDIKIGASGSLKIEAGAELVFCGPYEIRVSDDGILQANGQPGKMIGFKSANKNVSWRGIRFINCSEKSYIRNAVISDVKQPSYDFESGAIYINNSNGLGGIQPASSPEVTGCVIYNNTSGYSLGGGGINIQHAQNPVVFQNVLANNYSYSGGGITLVDSHDSYLCNNTIVFNNCYEPTAGLFLSESTFKAYNNIIWFNRNAMLQSNLYNGRVQVETRFDTLTAFGDIDTIVAYSNIENSYPGENIIADAPDFMDPANHLGPVEYGTESDWHLQSGDLSKTSGLKITEIGAYGKMPEAFLVESDTVDLGIIPRSDLPFEIAIPVFNLSFSGSPEIDSVTGSNPEILRLFLPDQILEGHKSNSLAVPIYVDKVGELNCDIRIYSDAILNNQVIHLSGTIKNIDIPGCDTVYTTEFVAICSNENYKGWTEADTYVETLTKADGCDSIVTTTLTVNPAYNISEDIGICEGKEYLGRSETGIYVRELETTLGCDSIITTTLTVHPVKETIEEVEICEGSSYKGHNTTGQYIEDLVTQEGCDSTVILNLTLIPVYEITEDVAICEGSTYKGYSETGQYIEEFSTTTGCDSTVVINLMVNPAYETEEDRTICEGDSFKGHTESGQYTEELVSTLGCDSIVITNLEVVEAFETSEYIFICEGEEYLGLDESGIYPRNFTSIGGCDSVVTTYLTVYPVKKTFEEVTICNGSSYLGHTSAGTFSRKMVSSNGCDSIVTTNLSVLPVKKMTEYVSICEGESYKGWATGGQYTDSLVAANGCDSIVTTNLSINPVYQISEDITICKGGSYKGWVDEGQHEELLISEAGCDSLVRSNLSFYPSYSPEVGVEGNTLHSVNDFMTYQWYDESGEIPGATEKEYQITRTGTYFLVIVDENGCANTSAEVQAVYTSGNQIGDANFEYSIIPNPSDGNFILRFDSETKHDLTLTLFNETGQALETRKVSLFSSGQVEQFEVSQFAKGIYFLILSSETFRVSEKVVVY